MEHPASGRNSLTRTSVGLRTVAVLAAARGAVVLLLGFGVLHLARGNPDNIAQQLVEILHVNPEGKLSNVFIELASHITDRTLWALAMGALVYAAVRWIEAYGLWKEREWAQWFELLSIALYLPPELYLLMRHPSWLKWTVLVTNLAIFAFMLTVRLKSIRYQRNSRT